MRRFSCVLTREEYSGWKGHRLANGLIELFVVPELGGRIIQLRLGSFEFFYVNPRHRGQVYSPEENCLRAGWKNYGGSKVWPAPQGWESKEQWPGPPDPILDGGAYFCRVVEESPESVAVYLESQHDEYTGLTFAREIRLLADCSTAHILHNMRNTSSRPVRWGIWQVTQQDAQRPLVVYAPARRYRQIFGDKVFEHIEVDRKKGLWKLKYANQVAKFVVEAEQGWLVALRPEEHFALVEEFPLYRERCYPDGAPTEFWVNGEGTFTFPGGQVDMQADPNGCDPFVETEVLSPQTQLEPGQEYTFPVTWHATTVARQWVTSVNPLALVSEPVAINSLDGQVRVTGAFGLFQAGSLEIALLDREGKPLDTLTLGNFTPLEPCRIDKRLNHCDGLGQLSIRLRDSAGRLVGTVAEVSLIS